MKKVFSNVASVVISLAACNPERGELPKVKGAGSAKAAVSNQRVIVRSPFGKVGLRKILGLSGPAGNALVVLADVTTLKGAPDWAVCRTPIFHPPRAAFAN